MLPETVVMSYTPILNSYYSDNEEFMALKIQKVWRGYCARDPLFSLETRRKVVTLIVDEEELQKQPRSVHGNTPVYFPTDIPKIVIKACVDGEAKIRSEKAVQMRNFLQQHGCHHLVVPRSYYNKEGFQIEERLPLPSLYPEAQIDLYCKNKDLFSGAVRDFTKLYCLTSLRGVSGRIEGADLEGLEVLRTDNYPLYIDKEGRIGLIDLEHWTLEKKEGLCFFDRLDQLAVFFPYHCDQIIETAESIGDGKLSDAVRNEIKCYAERGIRVFDKIWFDYRLNLLSRGISKERPETPPRLSDQKKEELIQKIAQNYFSCSPQKVQFLLENKFFSQILDIFLKECESLLKVRELSVPLKDDVELCHYRRQGFYDFNSIFNTSNLSEMISYFRSLEDEISVEEILRIKSMSLTMILQQLEEWGEIYSFRGPIKGSIDPYFSIQF